MVRTATRLGPVDQQPGSRQAPMGRVYRKQSPRCWPRVTAALDERIGRALAVAAYLLRERPDWRAVDGGEGR